MPKCKQCGVEYEAKRSTSSYCSPKCKQEFYRNRINAKPETVTVKQNKLVTVTKGKCKYCGKQLNYTVLVCCYECSLKQPTKPALPAREGHILASRPALEFTGKLTDYERKHYKPASELKHGEFNSVSKPGDLDYEPQCETSRRFVEGGP